MKIYRCPHEPSRDQNNNFHSILVHVPGWGRGDALHISNSSYYCFSAFIWGKPQHKSLAEACYLDNSYPSQREIITGDKYQNNCSPFTMLHIQTWGIEPHHAVATSPATPYSYGFVTRRFDKISLEFFRSRQRQPFLTRERDRAGAIYP